jgi:hypothetical protein
MLRHIINLLCIEDMTWHSPLMAYVLLLDSAVPSANSQILSLFEQAIYASYRSEAEQVLATHIFSLLDESTAFTYLKETYTDLPQTEVMIDGQPINFREQLLTNTVEVMFVTHQIAHFAYKTTMKEILKQWLQ